MSDTKPEPVIRQQRNGSIEAMMHEGEKLIRVAHVSQAIYWKGIVVLIFAGVVLLNPFFHNLGILFMVVALLMLSHAYLTRFYLMLVLTDKRVLIRRGILNIDVMQLRLTKIESVELEWTPVGRILNYAVVVVSGTGSRVVAVPFISDGSAFRKQMDDMLFAQEEKQTHVIIDAVEKPPA